MFTSITYCKKLVQLHRPCPVRRRPCLQPCARIRIHSPRVAQKCREVAPNPPPPRSPATTMPTRTVAPFSSSFSIIEKNLEKLRISVNVFLFHKKNRHPHNIHYYYCSPLFVQSIFGAILSRESI